MNKRVMALAVAAVTVASAAILAPTILGAASGELSGKGTAYANPDPIAVTTQGCVGGRRFLDPISFSANGLASSVRDVRITGPGIASNINMSATGSVPNRTAGPSSLASTCVATGTPLTYTANFCEQNCGQQSAGTKSLALTETTPITPGGSSSATILCAPGATTGKLQSDLVLSATFNAGNSILKSASVTGAGTGGAAPIARVSNAAGETRSHTITAGTLGLPCVDGNQTYTFKALDGGTTLQSVDRIVAFSTAPCPSGQVCTQP